MEKKKSATFILSRMSHPILLFIVSLLFFITSGRRQFKLKVGAELASERNSSFPQHCPGCITWRHKSAFYYTRLETLILFENTYVCRSVLSNPSPRGLAHSTRDRLLRKLADTNNCPILTDLLWVNSFQHGCFSENQIVFINKLNMVFYSILNYVPILGKPDF